MSGAEGGEGPAASAVLLRRPPSPVSELLARLKSVSVEKVPLAANIPNCCQSSGMVPAGKGAVVVWWWWCVEGVGCVPAEACSRAQVYARKSPPVRRIGTPWGEPQLIACLRSC